MASRRTISKGWALARRFDEPNRVGATVGGHHDHLVTGQELGQDPAIELVVVDHENPGTCELVIVRALGNSADWQVECELKRAALSRLALDGNMTAHQLDQHRGDRQPQAGATELASG
jgi:hypothetical protein